MADETANSGLEDRLFKGRGAARNPKARFDRLGTEPFDDGWDTLALTWEEDGRPATEVSADRSRSVIARNQSPDIPFDQSINPYRGCEHGCIYCYARPSHAFLGLSPGLDFETKLWAKYDAAELLVKELARPGYSCSPIALGANTDPYQPVERKLGITRKIVDVLSRHDHPLTIVTKSAAVLRDLDILAPMAEKGLASVAISITTLDPALARRMEPRAAAPHRRIETLRELAAARHSNRGHGGSHHSRPYRSRNRIDPGGRRRQPAPGGPPTHCCACPMRLRSCSETGCYITNR